MSRAYNCLDNAVAESFLATLEHELASRSNWTSPDAAEHDMRDFVLDFYDHKRIHPSNHYRSPAAYEAQAV
jgi:transposase InsO family protein